MASLFRSAGIQIPGARRFTIRHPDLPRPGPFFRPAHQTWEGYLPRRFDRVAAIFERRMEEGRGKKN